MSFNALNKYVFVSEVGRYGDVLRSRSDHSLEELDKVCMDIPIRVLSDSSALAKYCYDIGLSMTDSFIVFAWCTKIYPFIRDLKYRGDVSYGVSSEWYEKVRMHTIVLHRLNYILHESMLCVYDIAESAKRLRFGVKRAVSLAENPWHEYMSARKSSIESTAWYTLQDHLRLANDAVSPFIEKVYEAIRDNMISRGFRDVELRARIAIVFLLAKVCKHSVHAFFRDFEAECGIDYTKCFDSESMGGMVRLFANVCSSLGFKVEKDACGDYSVEGFNEDSVRFKSAWGRLMSSLRDDDLMDDAARNAIALNPEARKEYKHILEEEEKNALSDSLERLSEKFNVKKVS